MNKNTTVTLSPEELKFQQRVKSVELAIKAQGRGAISSKTLVEISESIFKYLKS